MRISKTRILHFLTISLCNLIACREVGIKVVFPVESRAWLNIGIQSQRSADCEFHAFRVQALCFVSGTKDREGQMVAHR